MAQDLPKAVHNYLANQGISSCYGVWKTM